ncbi:MAG: tetratricopeptide repeat protein [Candidatus Solibacter usitatus]|nr:tetratricopeptide repeat protein [Candidatus Solibacter usitatus]
MVVLLFLLFADSFDVKLREGLAALNRNDLAAAQASLEAASLMQPESARPWVGLAQAHFRSGRAEQAREAARKAESLGGADPVALYGLAMFHLQSGSPKAAVETGRRLIALEDRAEARNLLGKALEAEGRFDEAIAELHQAVRLNRYEESHHFDLAQLLLRRQKFDAAIQTLEASRKIFARSGQLELALGVAYYGQRRFAEAVESFLRTIAIAPEAEQPYVFLSRIIDQAGERLGEIAARFAAFAKANPGSYLGCYLQAKAGLAQGGDAGRAERLLRQAIAIESRHAESHFELGGLLEKQRLWVEAAREFQRAAELSPHDPVPHYRLARIFDRLGQAERAEAERALHQRLSAEEAAAIDRRVAAFAVK